MQYILRNATHAWYLLDAFRAGRSYPSCFYLECINFMLFLHILAALERALLIAKATVSVLAFFLFKTLLRSFQNENGPLSTPYLLSKDCRGSWLMAHFQHIREWHLTKECRVAWNERWGNEPLNVLKRWVACFISVPEGSISSTV